MSAHTPTLWIADHNMALASDGAPIARAFSAEDGQHIVRCVNAHDQAITALRAAIEVIEAWHGPVAWETYRDHSPEMKLIVGALTAAEAA